jgi:SAM-dependent methyltransferase
MRATGMPVMVAIAHQCFNAEYVFDETEEERTALERLKVSEAPSCASLARRQIVEPAEERRLAAAIPALSKEASAVSAAVRAQYEANPYPRWVRLPWVAPQAGERLSILIAGCGTGQQAILTAQRYPASRVLAVDLSLASLGYAARKTLEAGIRNIEYRQADILALDALEERFDLIECSGVLHHLEDPLEGWRILAGLRKPGARMRIGLYSELGRRAVVRARELIAARGFKPDAQGIRAARAEIRNDPQLEQLARNEDFYSMSGCRDLLFHVQEQRFTLPGIEAALAALGLEFVEFEFADSGASLQRYRSRFSDERDLKSWARFEEEFPDTFSRMYQFQVR